MDIREQLTYYGILSEDLDDAATHAEELMEMGPLDLAEFAEAYAALGG
jgi:hypothetical protein